MTREAEIAKLKKDWAENPRWKGIKRGYSAEDVVRLRGSLQIEHTLAKRGAEKLWSAGQRLAAKKGYVNAFGAISAGQAMQQAKAGLEAVYLSGWQVAADGNTSETMYPDQSLYAYDSVPTMVRRINNTFKRADEIQWSRGIDPESEEGLHRLLPADRGRRGSRFRRRAERLRTDEEHDRRRCRRRALRRPARCREEVRPHGRQGARADAGSLSRS
jgi:isocitrate lyase